SKALISGFTPYFPICRRLWWGSHGCRHSEQAYLSNSAGNEGVIWVRFFEWLQSALDAFGGRLPLRQKKRGAVGIGQSPPECYCAEHCLIGPCAAWFLRTRNRGPSPSHSSEHIVRGRRVACRDDR